MALIAAYSFDESGTTVTDYSGNANSFSIDSTNAERTPDGHTNGGLTKFQVGVMPQLPLIGQTANRTVMMWLRNEGTFDRPWHIIWNIPSLSSGGWGLLTLSGNISVQARNASTFVRPGVPHPTDSLWHHYAGTATYDSGADQTTVRLFVDGAEADSATLSGQLRTDADSLSIIDWSTAPRADIDDLRIYDGALDQAAIVTAMNTPVTYTTRWQRGDGAVLLPFLKTSGGLVELQ